MNFNAIHSSFMFFGREIPFYGCMIAVGVFVSAALGYILVRRAKLSYDNFLVLACFAFGGGMIGAKGLFLLLHAKEIQWSRMTEPSYLNMVMRSGFVFYGGLILGIFFVLLGGSLFQIPLIPYLKAGLPCLPLVHCFGRIGCFLTGCCYGVPYDGPFAVIYSESSVTAPGSIPLFPIQLMESAGLLLISVMLIFAFWYKVPLDIEISLYLSVYGFFRFLLEFLRYDIMERRIFFGLSTSQWISIFLFLFALGVALTYQRRQRNIF